MKSSGKSFTGIEDFFFPLFSTRVQVCHPRIRLTLSVEFVVVVECLALSVVVLVRVECLWIVVGVQDPPIFQRLSGIRCLWRACVPFAIVCLDECVSKVSKEIWSPKK